MGGSGDHDAAKRVSTLREMRKQAAVMLGGLPYRILGRLAQGEMSDVFLAERARRISERVVIKLVRDPSDADLLEREVHVVTQLGQLEVRGARHFRRLIPEPIHCGVVELNGTAHPSAVYRHRPGFAHTLTDILRAHPEGVDPRHAAWIWRRALELLSWLHTAGVVHGAPLPEHLIIHPAEHGLMLVGFCCAVGGDSPASLLGVSAAHRRFYPQETLRGRPLDPAVDLTVVARAIRYLLGGGEDALPRSVPEPLSRLIHTYAEHPAGRWPTGDAFELRQLVGQVAREVFGPPRFIDLHMPAVAAH